MATIIKKQSYFLQVKLLKLMLLAQEKSRFDVIHRELNAPVFELQAPPMLVSTLPQTTVISLSKGPIFPKPLLPHAEGRRAAVKATSEHKTKSNKHSGYTACKMVEFWITTVYTFDHLITYDQYLLRSVSEKQMWTFPCIKDNKAVFPPNNFVNTLYSLICTTVTSCTFTRNWTGFQHTSHINPIHFQIKSQHTCVTQLLAP